MIVGLLCSCDRLLIGLCACVLSCKAILEVNKCLKQQDAAVSINCDGCCVIQALEFCYSESLGILNTPKPYLVRVSMRNAKGFM